MGHAARAWFGLDSKPRLSNPSNIEKHMQQRGLFEADPELGPAWDTTMIEYRQQRLASAAADAGVTPGQLGAMISDPLPGMAVQAAPRAPQSAEQVLADVSVRLEAIERALGKLMAAMGLELGWDVPIDWQALADAAEHAG